MKDRVGIRTTFKNFEANVSQDGWESCQQLRFGITNKEDYKENMNRGVRGIIIINTIILQPQALFMYGERLISKEEMADCEEITKRLFKKLSIQFDKLEWTGIEEP